MISHIQNEILKQKNLSGSGLEGAPQRYAPITKNTAQTTQQSLGELKETLRPKETLRLSWLPDSAIRVSRKASFSVLLKDYFQWAKKRKTKSGTNSSNTSQDSVKQDSKIRKTSVDDTMDLTAITDRLDQLSTQTNAGFKQLHEDSDTTRN